MSAWAIDDDDGTELSSGYEDEHHARLVARTIASRIGKSVYIYEVTGDDGGAVYEEVKP